MASSQQVTLNTSSASLLAECTAEPALDLRLQVSGSGGTSTYLGGSGVTSSTGFLAGEAALNSLVAVESFKYNQSGIRGDNNEPKVMVGTRRIGAEPGPHWARYRW